MGDGDKKVVPKEGKQKPNKGISLPSRQFIQGEPWHITYTDDQLTDLDIGGDLLGLYKPDDQEIIIYRGKRAAEAVWKTLMHEMLHAMAAVYNIKCLQKERNHSDLDVLANALVDWMLANRFLKVQKPKVEKPDASRQD